MNDVAHINLAELDAVLKGISLVLQWGQKIAYADRLLMRVPQGEMTKINHLSRHPGVRRMCYFVWLTNPSVSTNAIRAIVKEYQMCQSIDPTPVKWRKGKLGVRSTWSRLAMEITHYSSQHFLMLIDCEASRFAV